MLIRCILSDAHIGIVRDNKGFVTYEQIVKYKDYVVDIYDKLSKSDIGLYEIEYYLIKDLRYSSLNSSICFKTHNSELLHAFVNMFLSI